jgi:hypothetical protein
MVVMDVSNMTHSATREVEQQAVGLVGRWQLIALENLMIMVHQFPQTSQSLPRCVSSWMLPLPQLSPADAAALVVKHLDNRTRSRQSRIRRSSDP